MEEPTTAFDLQRMFVGDEPLLFTLEVVVRTTIMFAYTVALVRLLGKRGMRQLTPFELVIIIALGSAVGDPMFYADVPVLHGLVVITVIVALEGLLAWGTGRSRRVEHVLESPPTLLVRDGRLEPRVIQGERIALDDLFADLREAGFDNLGDIRVAIIESSGNMSVFPSDRDPERPGMWLLPEDVEPPEARVVSGFVACGRCGEVRRGAADADAECGRCLSNDGWRPAVTSPEPARQPA